MIEKINQLVINKRSDKRFKNYIALVNQIRNEDLSNCSDSEIVKRIKGLRFDGEKGNADKNQIIKLFSIVNELIIRKLNLQPYKVQILAGLAMLDRQIIEMKTGEGKTVASVFTICYRALSGDKVHVVTANDYLAKRDCELNRPIYEALNLTVDYLSHNMTVEQRQRVYEKNIIYSTIKEIGYDYLKNFVCSSVSQYIQMEFDFAIIDEADSVLIDEAKNPMVIAGRGDSENDMSLEKIASFVQKLKLEKDYLINSLEMQISLTNRGINRFENEFNRDNIYSVENSEYLAKVTYALEAQYLYQKDVDYIIKENQLLQIDSNSGRVIKDRKWTLGLQRALEVKEKCDITEKTIIYAQISVEHLVNKYKSVSGMTGTAVSSRDEFDYKYNMSVLVIPEKEKCIREDFNDRVFLRKKDKYSALIENVIKQHAIGRPILIGTNSVKESNEIFEKLKSKGISSQVLNAKNDDEEAEIIRDAGGIGKVTVSTNMAGRGTDIKLGSVNKHEKQQVIELGGLYVIGTNRHKNKRIDNQLRGRAGRHGEPGESQFYISLEDTLIQKFSSKRFMQSVLKTSGNNIEISSKYIYKQIDLIQRISQGNDERIRENVSKYSELFETHFKDIFDLRESILFKRHYKKICSEFLPQKYKSLEKLYGEEFIENLETNILLELINKYWTIYLNEASDLRQSIYLVHIGKKNPVAEYNKIMSRLYKKIIDEILNETITILDSIDIENYKIEMTKKKEFKSSTVLTYLLDDSEEALGIDTSYDNPMVAFFTIPLIIPMYILKRFKRRRNDEY